MRKTLYCMLILFGLFGLVACARTAQPSQPANPRLVIAHTQGIISRFDPLTVVLSGGRAQAGLEANPFTVTPALPGRAVWSEDGSRVDFVPSQPLVAGQSYSVRFDFTALDEPENGWFSFQVQAAQPSFALSGLRLSAQKDGRLSLSGTLRAEDIPATADVEAILQARLGRSSLPLAWTHAGLGVHHFTVRNIERAAAAAELVLAWDGRPAAASLRGSETFTIPAEGSFEVLSISGPESGEAAALTLAFSEPIDPAQDLRGYIHAGMVQDLRYEVDGGLVRVYTAQRWPDQVDVQVEPGLRSANNRSLAVPIQAAVSLNWQIPQVRFAPGGIIVPSTQGTTVVLETMNLSHVYVEALRVYGDNMLQFLQVNELNGNRELKRVGDVVWSDTIELGWSDDQKNRWIQHALDLSPLLEKHPDGMFQLRVVFGREHIRYISPNNHTDIGRWEFPPLRIVDPEDQQSSYWDWYESWFDWNEYYRFRQDPTHPAFYVVRYGQDRSARRNVLVSDIGIMAKRDVEGTWHVATSDLRSVRPLTGARVTAYSYSLRELGRGIVDASGMASIKPAQGAEPAFLVVDSPTNARGMGYLKLNQALAASHFDIGGERAETGLKGFIYGDRGVWRPGDDMHLVFILYDRLANLPADHPVSFDLINPLGQVVRSSVHTDPVNGFYYIKTATEATAPTGNWTARVRAGGSTFTKTLKVETIMPNRLKMSLDYGSQTWVAASTERMGLSAAWLHGAPAPNLRADVSMILSPSSRGVGGYQDYQFYDPLRTVPAARRILYEGNLDGRGESSFNVRLEPASPAPGPLTATFLSRVYERSGLFSSETFSVDYHPYERYVGVKLPRGDAARNMLLTDVDHKVELVLVDRDGRLVQGTHRLNVTLYKLQWRWWWEKGQESLAEQAGDIYRSRIATDTVEVRNGLGNWNLNIKYPSWGRYLVHISDPSGGHASGQVFYIDWPGWAGRSQADAGDSAMMLTLTTSKPVYNVGETVRVSFPSNRQGRAFVTIERSGRVLRQEWIDTSADNTVYQFPATMAMAPNVYVHVSFVQGHLQTANDLPIRLYGIVPVMVENPATRLEPRLGLPTALAPAATSSFSVSEASGKPMTYTVAVVDEGLLGITRYATPNPWNEFYKKEASLLRSFDLYKDVANAFTGRLQTLLAIGGSEFGDEGGERKVNRFPPVVRFFGPYQLADGQRREHQLELGPYIGAVRFMVVAGTPQGAYGRYEQEVPVRSDLMTFVTAPRVLGPGERLTVPVNVFSFLGTNQPVEVSLKVEGQADLVGSGSQQLRFAADGDQSADFEVLVREREGAVRLTATASGGGRQSVQTIEIPVRSAAVPVTSVNSSILAGNRSSSLAMELPGISGSNETWLELSTLPPIDLSSRLGYLIGYPHGCAEQTTSRAFPQLFLKDATVLSPDQAREVQSNVDAAIAKLQQMQTAGGGFVFWPGAYNEGQWLSAYITHFLVMANRQGYTVSQAVLDKALAYLHSQSTTWSSRENYARAEQAYRLYVLAHAGRPNIAAMNRYFEYGPHPASAQYQMAAAYALAGNRQRAAEILQSAPSQVSTYSGMEQTYGSSLRDRALMLEALNVIGDTARALPLFKEIAEQLSSRRSLNTQELSFALVASLPYMKLASTTRADVSWSFASGSAAQSAAQRLSVGSGVTRIRVPADSGRLTLNFTNHGAAAVYARLIATGSPLPGQETAQNNGLALSVRYLDSSEQPVNPDSLALGQDVIIELQVRNTHSQPLSDIALTFRAPAGWELSNPRLGSAGENAGPGESPYDYRDLRDDRVMTYFPLNRNETRTFRVYANKTYNGEFYLPAVVAEAMYFPEIQAVVPGRKLGRPVQVPVRGSSAQPSSR